MYSFEMDAIAPFRLELVVWLLKRIPQDAINLWDGRVLRRTLVIDDRPVVVEVEQIAHGARPRVRATIHTDGKSKPSNEMVRALTRTLNRLLGLQIDLTEFYKIAGKKRKLAALAEQFAGVKPPIFPAVFEGFVGAVACQQVSLHVGISCINKLAKEYGVPAGDGLQSAFPRPVDLADLEPEPLKKLAFSTNKARYVIDMAQSIVEGRVDLDAYNSLDDATMFARLTSMRGIGKWTAEYMMLRGYGRLNIFPIDDSGARARLFSFLDLSADDALDRAELEKLVHMWKPYSGLLYLHLLLSRLHKEGHIPNA